MCFICGSDERIRTTPLSAGRGCSRSGDRRLSGVHCRSTIGASLEMRFLITRSIPAASCRCRISRSRSTRRTRSGRKFTEVLARYLTPVAPIRVKKKWDAPVSSLHCEVTDIPKLVAECEIDHSVAPSAEFRGGRKEAKRRLKYFLENNLQALREDQQSAVGEIDIGAESLSALRADFVAGSRARG